MKTRIIRIFAFAAVALTIVSCSRKKDNFINRSWHSVGTEYNILYNGNIALEQGKAALAEGYADNYWEILPVERLQVEDEISLPGQSKNADFERAEEKAVKAIQRHSMNIEGKEKNPQMDEAAGFAVRYYNDFVKPTKVYRAPTDQERAAMQDLVARLKKWDGGLDAEELQSMVFAVGKDHEFEPLRAWFTALYEVLLGASQGPRFGGFIALYGVEETIALIEDRLS